MNTIKDKPNHYLVTGANGQLGREWVDYLSASGLTYVAMKSDEMDITDFETTQSFLIHYKPTYVVNCAAYTKVDLAETEVDKANLVNHLAVEHLAKICSELNIVLIHYSTDYVFGGLESDIEMYSKGYPIHAEVNPQNQYGRSKLLGEVAIARHHKKAIIIRVSWLCGRYGSNFVKTILKIASANPEISVVNDQFGSPSFAASTVKISNLLIEKSAFGLHHVSSCGTISWHEFASEIVKKYELKCFVKPVDSLAYPTKVKRPAFSKLDCSKTEEILGSRMTHWKDGLSDLLTELKN
jgi:dTDP-4-dehydrorhamnose reductase